MVHKYPDRTTPWVKKNLIQKPKPVRRGKDWAEYVIGRLPDIIPQVHRFEFESSLNDQTDGAFHVLSLVQGESVFIQSLLLPERQFTLNFTETVIVPAGLGKYTITNLGKGTCKVLKTFVNPSYLA
jgi:hypothetical protein